MWLNVVAGEQNCGAGPSIKKSFERAPDKSFLPVEHCSLCDGAVTVGWSHLWLKCKRHTEPRVNVAGVNIIGLLAHADLVIHVAWPVTATIPCKE